jgi:hypothetical protein
LKVENSVFPTTKDYTHTFKYDLNPFILVDHSTEVCLSRSTRPKIQEIITELDGAVGADGGFSQFVIRDSMLKHGVHLLVDEKGIWAEKDRE